MAAGTATADVDRSSAQGDNRGSRAADCRDGFAFSRSGMWTKPRDEQHQANQFATVVLASDADDDRYGDGEDSDGEDNVVNAHRGCADGKKNGDRNRDGGGDGGGSDENDGNDDGGDGDGDNADGQGDNDGGGDNNENAQFPGRDQAGGPSRKDFVRIQDVSPNVADPESGSDASTGSFTSVCGTNGENHRNSDNFMVAPGKVNGAQHVHDYVGNLSTDAFSDDESLGAADTTCAKGDKSTYYWPVLRNVKGRDDDANEDGGGLDGNIGRILRPATVTLEFRGNPQDSVTAMPENLAVITGDAKAGTNGDANAKAAWSCTGFEDRVTTKYPLCPRGSQLLRILDFPSCWDGENTDSANHRTHIVFPAKDGSCRDGTVAVPQLRMTLTYERPAGRSFAVDSFPDQRHNPITDHGDFMNLMPDDLMDEAVDCINNGKDC